jgi:hypothetical protein
MPFLTRWFIKTSFVYLGIALALGILLAGQSPWHLSLTIANLFPGYIHLLTVGWLTQLIFGVAYWMFPKYTLEHPHGSETLNWSAYILINMGLLIRIVNEPISIQTQAAFWGWMLALSALLQWLGGMLFILNLWNRVKGR